MHLTASMVVSLGECHDGGQGLGSNDLYWAGSGQAVLFPDKDWVSSVSFLDSSFASNVLFSDIN